MRRYGLRDEGWDRIKDFLPGREGHVGGTAADNRSALQSMLEERSFPAYFSSCWEYR
jgi:hypothetical protein